MGIARGPNLIKDNLVFGYDTGYGAADNYTSTRFYKGKPVDNMATDPTFLNSTVGTFSSSAWGGDTGFGEFATNTSPDGGGLMYINHNTSTATGGGGNYNDLDVNNWTLTNGVTYTRSWWAKSNITQTINGHMLSVNGGGNNTYILGDNTDLVAGEWKRVSHTFTYTGTSNLDWRFRSINYNQSKVYIANIQLEVGSYASPFTATSRSDTQSLIELTKTTDIDWGAYSFDSNGQPFWDGTNDRTDVTSYPAIEIVDDVSIEYVYKRLSTDPVLDVIANKYHSTGWELFCTTANKFALAGRNGDGTYYSMSNGAYTIQNNQYYHLVAIKEGLSWRLYVNGELYASLTANSVGTWSNTGVLQIGGEGNGYFPHMELPVLKIYNKVLSVAEIKQNYNAYKNRFDI
jgi:hypothetical protein